MNIVFHHKGVLPVKKYGGIERMIFWHMCELVKLGHKVYLIGHKNSQVKEHGIHLIPQLNKKNWWELIPDHSDIVQLFYNFELPIDIPTIVTMGCNGQLCEKFSKNTVFVSKNHAANHGSDIFIYNGIDFNEYQFTPKKTREWNNFLFLAKASWKVKNVKDCISICKKLKKHLHIAGGSYWRPSRYIHSHGMVGGPEKTSLLKQADALLFPILWPEPFGIAMIEAMAHGVPVIGSSYGSLPEIISKEVGVICKNKEEFFHIINRSENNFDPEAIRHYAITNFSIEKFTNEYLKIFKRVLSGKVLNDKNPQFLKEGRAEDLLPF